MRSQKNTVLDIYIMRRSGIPIFAGCTGTAYCKAHVGQHELHSGFISAIYSFSKESFQETQLEAIQFDKIQINVIVDDKNDTLIVFIHPQTVKQSIVKKQMMYVFDLLRKKYYSRITENQLDDVISDEFESDLRAKQIIPKTNLIATNSMQMLKKKLLEYFSQKS